MYLYMDVHFLLLLLLLLLLLYDIHTRVQNVPLFIFRSHCQSPVAEESPVLKKRERDGPKDVSSPTISPSQQIPCVRLLMKHRLLLPPIVCAFSLSLYRGVCRLCPGRRECRPSIFLSSEDGQIDGGRVDIVRLVRRRFL